MLSETCKLSQLNITDSNPNNTNRKPLKLTCGSFYLPKRNKARPRGEDAHFICTDKSTIGVADGVRQRRRKLLPRSDGRRSPPHGNDAGNYSRDLMAAALRRQTNGSVDPARVLQTAHGRTRARGSSTALIIALNENGSLRYANFGDSGLVLFRGGKPIHESPIQRYSFNFPYHLGAGDDLDPAEEGEVRVEEGDVVVAAEIGERAHRNSVDGGWFSPFAKAAKEAGKEYSGGKYDDITVVVAKIEPL